MLRLFWCCSVAALCVFSTSDVSAQTADAASTEAPATDSATETVADDALADGLLTAAELQTLVSPVALYPDTLLIQVLVAATAPLDVIKADRLVQSNEGADIRPLLDAEEFDASVSVLAEAFPDVLSNMAEHIEWTETVGMAMLAQDQDVMDAVQVMRQQAINSGALIDSPEQDVTVEETLSTKGTPTETVVIQPADPEVVYVPQYDYQTVYEPNSTSVGDVVATTAIAFGTAALINEIFDDDDDWNDYWGCRNCGGWGGGPIINDPHVDIDIDNDVNIGNGNIGNGNRPGKPGDGNRPGKPGDGNRPGKPGDKDRPETLPGKGGWEPKPEQRKEAQNKIANKKGENGATTMPIKRPPNKSDELRKNLAKETGARDISGDGVAAGAALGAGAAVGANQLSKASKKDALKKKGNSGKPVTRPANAKKPSAKKPAAKKPAAAKKPTAKKKTTTAKKKPAISKKTGGKKTKAASKRGKSSKKHSGKKKKR